MLMNMYSVYDKVSNRWQQPESAINDGVAERAFTTWVRNSEYKDDYEVYYVGQWDSENGVWADDTKLLITRGVSIAKHIQDTV